MKCRNCQKKIDKNLEKCPYCGTLLHDKKQNKKEVTPEEKIARGLVGVEGAAISGAIYASTKDTREKIGKNIKEKGAGYLGSKEFLNDLTGNHGANYASYETPNYDNVTSITAEAPTYMSSSTGTNGDSYVDFNSLYDSNGDVNYQIVNDFLNGSSSGEQLMTFLDSLSDAEAEQITGSIINALKDYMGNITGFDGLSNEDFAKLLSEYANIENGGNGKITKEALENFISEELNKQFKDLGKNIEFHLSENVLNFEEAGITVSEENGVKIYTDKDGNTFNSLEELVANHPETIDMVKVLNENGISTTLSRSELEKQLTDIINKQLEENGYDYKIVFNLSEKVLDLKKGNISKETDADGNVIYKDKDGKVYKSLEELVAAHPEIIDLQKVLEENGYDTKTPAAGDGGGGGGGRIDIDPMYLGFALDTLGGPKITGGSLTGWDCINKKANAITSISFPSGIGKGNAYTAATYKSPPASFSGLSGLCGSICAGFGLTGGGGGGGIDISAFLEQLHAQLSDLKSKIDDIDDTSIFNEEEKEAFNFSLYLTASERSDVNGGYEGYDGTETFENHERLLSEAEKHKDAAFEYLSKQAGAEFDKNLSKIMKEDYMELFESEFAQKYFEEHGALPKKGDPGYDEYKKQLLDAARTKYIETRTNVYETRLEISNQNMYLNYNSAIIKAGMHSFEVDTGEAIIKDGVITFKDGTKMSQEEYNKEMAMFEAIKADYLKGERGNIQNLEGYEKYLSGIGTYIYNSVYAQQYRDASDAYEKALQEYNDLKDPVNGISQRWGGTSGEYRDKLSAAEEELKRCEAAKNNYELKYTETTYKILAQYIYNENYYDIEYFNEQLAELEANYKAEMKLTVHPEDARELTEEYERKSQAINDEINRLMLSNNNYATALDRYLELNAEHNKELANIQEQKMTELGVQASKNKFLNFLIQMGNNLAASQARGNTWQFVFNRELYDATIVMVEEGAKANQDLYKLKQEEIETAMNAAGELYKTFNNQYMQFIAMGLYYSTLVPEFGKDFDLEVTGYKTVTKETHVQGDLTNVGESIVFYDKDGKVVKDPVAIAMFCIKEGLVDFQSKYKNRDVQEYLNNLFAVSESNGNNYSQEQLAKIFQTVYGKYGEDRVIDYFDYFNEIGASIRGQEASEESIRRIKELYSKDVEGFTKFFNVIFNLVGTSGYGDYTGIGLSESDIAKIKEQNEELAEETAIAIAKFCRLINVFEKSIDDGLKGFGDHWLDFFTADGRKSATDFETQAFMNALANDEEFAKIYQYSYEIGSSIGNMIPSIVATTLISAVTMGAGAGSGAALLSASGVRVAQMLASFATMGISAAGATKEQAMQGGMDATKATFYGLLSGLSEVGMEAVLGGIPGLSMFNKALEGIEHPIGKIFAGMISEAIEESVQEVFDGVLEAAFTDGKINIDPNQVLKAGIYGAITSGLMGGGGYVLNTAGVGVAFGYDNVFNDGTKVEYLIKKYGNLTLGDIFLNADLRNELRILNTIQWDNDANERIQAKIKDPSFNSKFNEYVSEETAAGREALTIEAFAKEEVFMDLLAQEKARQLINEETSKLIEERNQKLREMQEKIDAVHKLAQELGLSEEQINIATLTQNQEFMNKSKESSLSKESELLKLLNEVQALKTDAQVKGTEIYAKYKQVREELIDIIDTEGNEAKARELERAMLVYESYVGDVISLEIDASNTIEIAEEQKTNYEEVVRQQREIIKNNDQTIERLNKALKDGELDGKALTSTDISKIQERIKLLEKNNTKLNANIDKLNSLIVKCDLKIQTLLNTDVSNLVRESNVLNNRIELLERLLDELKEDLLKDAVDDGLKDAIEETLKAKFDSITDAQTALETEISNIKGSVSANEVRLNSLLDSIIKRENVGLRTDMAVPLIELIGREQEIIEYATVDGVESRIESTEITIEELANQYRENATELERVRQELKEKEDLRNQFLESQFTVDDRNIQREIESLRSQVEELERIEQDISSKLGEQDIRYEELNQLKVDKIDKLNKQLNDFITEYNSEIDSYNSRIETLQKQDVISKTEIDEIQRIREQIELLEKRRERIQTQINNNNAEIERITDGKVVSINSQPQEVSDSKAQLLKAVSGDGVLLGLLPHVGRMIGGLTGSGTSTPGSSGGTRTTMVSGTAGSVISVDSNGVININEQTKIGRDNPGSLLEVLPERDSFPSRTTPQTVSKYIELASTEDRIAYMQREDVKDTIINNFNKEQLAEFFRQDYDGRMTEMLFDKRGLEMLGESKNINRVLEALFSKGRIKDLIFNSSEFNNIVIENYSNIETALSRLSRLSVTDQLFLNDVAQAITDGRVDLEILDKFNTPEADYIKELLTPVEAKVDVTEDILSDVAAINGVVDNIENNQESSKGIRDLLKSLASKLSHNEFTANQKTDIITKLNGIKENIATKMNDVAQNIKNTFEQLNSRIDSLIKSLQTKPTIEEASIRVEPNEAGGISVQINPVDLSTGVPQGLVNMLNNTGIKVDKLTETRRLSLIQKYLEYEKALKLEEELYNAKYDLTNSDPNIAEKYKDAKIEMYEKLRELMKDINSINNSSFVDSEMELRFREALRGNERSARELIEINRSKYEEALRNKDYAKVDYYLRQRIEKALTLFNRGSLSDNSFIVEDLRVLVEEIFIESGVDPKELVNLSTKDILGKAGSIYEARVIDKLPTIKRNILGVEVTLCGTDLDSLELTEIRLRQCLEVIPSKVRNAIGNIRILDVDSPLEAYFKEKFEYTIPFGVAATQTNGEIRIFAHGFSSDVDANLNILMHEIGHCVDNLLVSRRGFFTNASSMWTDAMKADKAIGGSDSVTGYGKNTIQEDFAEAFNLYFADRFKFQQNYPNRAKVIENILAALQGEMDTNLSYADMRGMIPNLQRTVTNTQNISTTTTINNGYTIEQLSQMNIPQLLEAYNQSNEKAMILDLLFEEANGKEPFLIKIKSGELKRFLTGKSDAEIAKLRTKLEPTDYFKFDKIANDVRINAQPINVNSDNELSEDDLSHVVGGVPQDYGVSEYGKVVDPKNIDTTQMTPSQIVEYYKGRVLGRDQAIEIFKSFPNRTLEENVTIIEGLKYELLDSLVKLDSQNASSMARMFVKNNISFDLGKVSDEVILKLIENPSIVNDAGTLFILPDVVDNVFSRGTITPTEFFTHLNPKTINYMMMKLSFESGASYRNMLNNLTDLNAVKLILNQISTLEKRFVISETNKLIENLNSNMLLDLFTMFDSDKNIEARNTVLGELAVRQEYDIFNECLSRVKPKNKTQLLLDNMYTKGFVKAIRDVDAIKAVIKHYLANNEVDLALSNVMSELSPKMYNEIIRQLSTDEFNKLFHEVMISDTSFIKKLDVDGIKSLVEMKGTIIYTGLNVDQLVELSKAGNTEFYQYINNRQKMAYIRQTRNIELLDDLASNPKNFVNVKLRVTRTNGSNLSVELKNIINENGKSIYVYEINGETFFTYSEIATLLTLENNSPTKDLFLSEERLSRIKDGYLGMYQFDSAGKLVENFDGRTEILKAMDAHINNGVSFMDAVRDGDRNIRFGADQNIKKVNEDRALFRRSGLVETIDSESYERLVDHFSTKYNMDEATMRDAISRVVDAEGACSYADVANLIFLRFKDNSYAFKKTFGFDMYEFENGKKVLNARALVLDIFIRANSTDIGITDGKYDPKIFSIDPNTGQRVINYKVNDKGKVVPEEQVYMSRGNHFTSAAIKYLNDYGIEASFDILDYFDESGNLKVDEFKADIKRRLAQGEVVTMGEFVKMEIVKDENGVNVIGSDGKYERRVDPNQQPLTFHDLDHGRDITNINWNEGGGHATTIVGVTDDGILVVSWGRKYEIKFSDLRNYNCNFNSLRMDSATLRNVQTDMSIYADIAKMTPRKLADIVMTEDYDFDYIFKNYVSESSMDELVKLVPPSELLARVRSARSVELVLNSVKNNLGINEYNNLINNLTTEQKLLICRNQTISNKVKADVLHSIKSDKLLATMVNGLLELQNGSYNSAVELLTDDQVQLLLQSSNVDSEGKINIIETRQVDPISAIKYFKPNSIMSLARYANWTYTRREYTNFLKHLNFDQLVSVANSSARVEVLDALINASTDKKILSRVLFDIVDNSDHAALVNYFKGKTKEQLDIIKAKLNRDAISKVDSYLNEDIEDETTVQIFNDETTVELDEPTINPNRTVRDVEFRSPDEIFDELNQVSDVNAYLGKLQPQELARFVIRLNPEQMQVLRGKGIDPKYLEIRADDINSMDRGIGHVEPFISSRVEEASEANKVSLKDKLLSKITPNMSEVEKARLLYLELGSRIDYSAIYRYATITKNMDLYNEIYNGTKTVDDLLIDNSVICASWAQIYREMLLAAGFREDQIVMQRLTVKPEFENDNYVFNSHAAIYVTLSNGDIIIPDMTVPFNGAADFYNIKVGNTTGGFIYVTKEQIEAISQDWKSYPNNDVEYYSQIEAKGEINPDIKNFIEAAGSYFYGHVFSDETMAQLKQMKSDKFNIRRKQQNAFFNYFTNKNSDIITNADAHIQSLLTKSDFYVTEFTEDMKAMTKAVDNSLLKGMKELYDADEIVIKDVFSLYDSLTTLLGLGNVSNRNMGTLLSYLRETAKAEDIHYSAGKPGLSVSFTLDTTNEENTIKIYLYEDGNRVGNSRSYFELYLDETGKSFKVRHAQFDGKIVELVKRNPNLISKYDYSSFEASEFRRLGFKEAEDRGINISLLDQINSKIFSSVERTENQKTAIDVVKEAIKASGFNTTNFDNNLKTVLFSTFNGETGGKYNEVLNRINVSDKVYDIVHELFHMASANRGDEVITVGALVKENGKEYGYSLNEGITDLLTTRAFNGEFDIRYPIETFVAKTIIDLFGNDVFECYFSGNGAQLFEMLSQSNPKFVSAIKSLDKFTDKFIKICDDFAIYDDNVVYSACESLEDAMIDFFEAVNELKGPEVAKELFESFKSEITKNNDSNYPLRLLFNAAKYDVIESIESWIFDLDEMETLSESDVEIDSFEELLRKIDKNILPPSTNTVVVSKLNNVNNNLSNKLTQLSDSIRQRANKIINSINNLINKIIKIDHNRINQDAIKYDAKKAKKVLDLYKQKSESLINTGNMAEYDKHYNARLMFDLKMLNESSIEDKAMFVEDLKLLMPNNENLSDERIVEKACELYKERIIDSAPVETKVIMGIEVNLHGEDKARLRVLEVRLADTLEALPSKLRNTIKTVNIYDTNNPFDTFWKYKYGYNARFKSAASAGNETLNIYATGLKVSLNTNLGIITHEIGHLVDNYFGHGLYYTDLKPNWKRAMAADEKTGGSKAVTEYGSKHIREDFAESFMLYLADKALFQENYPYRARIIENLINNLPGEMNDQFSFVTRDVMNDNSGNVTEVFNPNKKPAYEKTLKILTDEELAGIKNELIGCDTAEEMDAILSKYERDTLEAFIDSLSYEEQAILYNDNVKLVKEILNDFMKLDQYLEIRLLLSGVEIQKLTYQERNLACNTFNYYKYTDSLESEIDKLIEKINNNQLARDYDINPDLVQYLLSEGIYLNGLSREQIDSLTQKYFEFLESADDDVLDSLHREIREINVSQAMPAPVISTSLADQVVSRIRILSGTTRNPVIKRFDIASKFEYTATTGEVFTITGKQQNEGRTFTGGAKHMLETICDTCEKLVKKEGLVYLYDSLKNEPSIPQSSKDILAALIKATDDSQILRLTEADNRKLNIVEQSIRMLSDKRLMNLYLEFRDKSITTVLGKVKDARGNNTNEFAFFKLLREAGIIDTNDVIISGKLSSGDEAILTRLLKEIKNNSELNFEQIRSIASKAVVILYSEYIEEYAKIPVSERKLGWLTVVKSKGKNIEIINGQGNNIFHLYVLRPTESVLTDIKSQLVKRMYDLYNDGVSKSQFKAKLIETVNNAYDSLGNRNHSYISDYYLRNRLLGTIEELFRSDNEGLKTFLNHAGTINRAPYRRDEISRLLGNITIPDVSLRVDNLTRNPNYDKKNIDGMLKTINNTIVKTFNSLPKRDFKNSIISDSSLLTDEDRMNAYKERLKERIVHDIITNNPSWNDNNIKTAIVLVENLFSARNGLDKFIEEAYNSSNLRIDSEYIVSRINNCKLIIDNILPNEELTTKLDRHKMLIKLEKIPSDVSVSLSNSGVAGFMNGDLLAASNDVLDGLMAGDDFRSELISWIKSTIDGNPNKSEIEKVLKHMYSTSEFDKYVKSIQKALDDGKTPNNNLHDVIKSLYF